MKDDKDNISYVSDKMFKNFENKYITPAFPDGYTENDARGYWRSPTGTTYSKKTKVVTILADDKSKQLEQKVNNLVNVYEKAYHQESVLVSTQRQIILLFKTGGEEEIRTLDSR